MIVKNNKIEYLSSFFMLVSIAFRTSYFCLVGFLSWCDIFVDFIIPMVACLMFICGEFFKSNKICFASVFLGCIFFALKSLEFSLFHMIFCLILYVCVAILAFLALFTSPKTKKTAACLFLAAFSYHVLIDIYELSTNSYGAIFPYLNEASVLFILLALILKFSLNLTIL
ncbi:MAG: hypothetical protein RR246_00380 [Clostridia bacterium]